MPKTKVSPLEREQVSLEPLDLGGMTTCAHQMLTKIIVAPNTCNRG